MAAKRDESYILLDISGTVFRIHRKLLKRFPNSLLSKLADSLHKNSSSKQMESLLPVEFSTTEEPNKFFVQRSPMLFEIILQCYITGKLHVPYWMCKMNFHQEISFWKLNPITDCCECCADHDAVPAEGGDLHDKLIMESEKNSEWHRLKCRMWRFFEKPNSSRGAFVSFKEFASTENRMIIV